MAEKPGSDEIYCSSCGEIIKKEAEICPECAVRNKSGAQNSSSGTSGLVGEDTGRAVSWVGGIFFLLGGAGMAADSTISGIISIIMGAFLVPPIRKRFEDIIDYNFSQLAVIGIVFFGMIIVGAFTPYDGGDISSSSTPDVDQEPQPVQNQTSQEKVQDESEKRTHSMDEEFNVGDVRYQVNDVSLRDRIGQTAAGTFMGVEANGQFLIVDMSVMNEADESIRMRTSSLKLMVGNAEYSPNTEASIYMDDSFTFEQLNPGVQVDGQIAYDVPESTTADSVKLKVSPVGLFSMAEPHFVNLSS